MSLYVSSVISHAAFAMPQLSVPTEGAYNGAYLDFGPDEDHVTLEAIEDFAALVGKRLAIIAIGNNWGKMQFPRQQVRIIHNSGAIPLILWYPREKLENTQTTRYSLESISAGQWDDYLDAWAKEARTSGQPLLVSWGLEMNGDWYVWSGLKHGGGAVIPNSDPINYRGPETFKQAYRHVVERVRAAGADNIQWVFHADNVSIPDEPWNAMRHYYPGDAYVDWLGMSAYGKQFLEWGWNKVEDVIVKPYQLLAAINPDKPILLAEWGVGEFPQDGNKGDWIRDALNCMRQAPRLKGQVFWHERWQNADLSYSNLRVNSSLESLTAFRAGIADPFWLERPQLTVIEPAR